jgi:hypothetical protein
VQHLVSSANYQTYKALNRVRELLTQNSVVAAIVLINLIATGVAAINPKVADRLFEIYLGSTVGLYGYLQQSEGNAYRRGDRERSSDDDEMSNH